MAMAHSRGPIQPCPYIVMPLYSYCLVPSSDSSKLSVQVAVAYRLSLVMTTDMLCHNYIGHNYIAHNGIGHGYMSHNHTANCSPLVDMTTNMVCHNYIGRSDTGHIYIGHGHTAYWASLVDVTTNIYICGMPQLHRPHLCRP